VSRRVRHSLSLEVLDEALAVCRLAADAELPPWAESGSFLTVSRTGGELSITVPQSAVPAGIRSERDYRALRVRGVLPHGLGGVLASIAEPLAEAGISIFAISTFDTDYVLVKEPDLAAARAALRAAGHEI
jgi:hypothetical protein